MQTKDWCEEAKAMLIPTLQRKSLLPLHWKSLTYLRYSGDLSKVRTRAVKILGCGTISENLSKLKLEINPVSFKETWSRPVCGFDSWRRQYMLEIKLQMFDAWINTLTSRSSSALHSFFLLLRRDLQESPIFCWDGWSHPALYRNRNSVSQSSSTIIALGQGTCPLPGFSNIHPTCFCTLFVRLLIWSVLSRQDLLLPTWLQRLQNPPEFPTDTL